MCARASWSTSQLLDEAAASSGVARDRLSIAKPPTVGAKTLTTKLVEALKWDESKLLQSPKVGSYPLQLRDGDVILLRDRELAATSGVTRGPPATATRGGGPGGAKRGGKFPTPTVVSGGAATREAGLRITTCYDVMEMDAPTAAVGVGLGVGGAAAPVGHGESSA